MLWLKLLLAGCVIAFGVGMGYFAAGKYRSRARFFAQLHDFNERYLTELGYARKPLSVLLKEYTGSGVFQRTLGRVTSAHVAQVGFSSLSPAGA